VRISVSRWTASCRAQVVELGVDGGHAFEDAPRFAGLVEVVGQRSRRGVVFLAFALEVAQSSAEIHALQDAPFEDVGLERLEAPTTASRPRSYRGILPLWLAQRH
jgi:hypothetical protein